jgi:hypothetical protein
MPGMEISIYSLTLASHLASGGGIKERYSRLALQQRLFDKFQSAGICKATSAPFESIRSLEEGRR